MLYLLVDFLHVTSSAISMASLKYFHLPNSQCGFDTYTCQSCLYCWLQLWFKLLGDRVWLNIWKRTEQKGIVCTCSQIYVYFQTVLLSTWCSSNLHQVPREGLGTLLSLTYRQEPYRSTYRSTLHCFWTLWEQFNGDS